jgi:FAD/FMN-containing dehydrogenase
LANAHGTTLPYGNGRSYGDSCLAATDHVLHARFMNRFISVEWDPGVVVAEAGVTLEELLALAIPRGRCFASPGADLSPTGRGKASPLTDPAQSKPIAPYACGCGSRPASGSGRGRGLPAGGTAEVRGVDGSSTDSRLGLLPFSRS